MYKCTVNMRRNKRNSHKKKQQNQTKDVRDTYLPRTESSFDILNTFDDIESITRRDNAELVQDLSDKDLTKSKKYKLHRKSEVKEVSLLPSNESVLCDLCSLRGVTKIKYSAFSCNSEDNDHKRNITAPECYLCCSEMDSFSQRNKRQISRTTRTETGDLESDFKSRSSVFHDKEQRHNSRKDLLRTRISEDNEKIAACSPLLLQTSRQEKAWNLRENRKISKGRKQRSKNYGPDIGTVNGKQLSNSIAPEFQNLRPYLPLLTLCQCPDYDSAIIEAVRDYNDPCRGVASLIYPTTNP